MISESRKIHLIEEVLKIDDEARLIALENFFKSSALTKGRIKDFVGIWTKEEAEIIERNIEKSCESVNSDDWK